MRATLLILTAVLVLAAGCSSEIGDSCATHTDCSPSGDRVCTFGAPDGYCTVLGCDHDTCPDEAVCVRFFAATSTSMTCEPATEDISTDACAPEELCTVAGSCMPRSAEIRYCMKPCSKDSDCRDGYHCRDHARMIEYGGEPVPPPGERLGSDAQGFCAVAPRS